MEDLQRKHKTIIYIMNYLFSLFGDNYFTIIDAWEGDLRAIGFTRKDKLIYIGTSGHLDNSPDDFKCYAEFETIDEHTLMPIRIERQLKDISKDELVANIRNFMNDAFSLN